MQRRRLLAGIATSAAVAGCLARLRAGDPDLTLSQGSTGVLAFEVTEVGGISASLNTAGARLHIEYDDVTLDPSPMGMLLGPRGTWIYEETQEEVEVAIPVVTADNAYHGTYDLTIRTWAEPRAEEEESVLTYEIRVA